MLRKALACAGALLVVFHVWLFAGQVWDGQLGDVALLGRWGAAAGLLLGLNRLRRQGVSLVTGRTAVAIWVLAGLLHGPAIADRAGALPGPAVPEMVATLASATLAGVAALGVLRLLSSIFAPRRAVRPSRADVADARPACRASVADFLVLAPRPPPLA